MCGRFTLTTSDIAALARQWAAEVDAALVASWRPRYNVAPGQAHLLLRSADGRRRLLPATFGLPTAGKGLQINARLETAASRPSFREAYARRRALVPADGFFEWEGPPAHRRPSWLHRPDGAPLLFAALAGPDEGVHRSFVLLTTEARGAVARLHDRMPVVVGASMVEAWLADGPPPELEPAPEGLLVASEVSTRVNGTEHDDPQCLAPPTQPPQLRLL